MFERAILNLDLDTFFAAVEMRRNPGLAQKPLVISGQGSRSVVASCNSLAHQLGVRPAMPLRFVRQLCPDATVLRGDFEAYWRESSIVREIIAEAAPVCEQAALDTFYADLSGLDRYFGCWRWAGELRQRLICETGLPLSMSLAVNKLVARVGAREARPNGTRLVETGAERLFLAPLTLPKLPGVTPATARRLNLMGVRRVGTLAALPPLLLVREMGPPGRTLWEQANAIDDSPVVPLTAPDSLTAEYTLAVDSIDPQQLREHLTALLLPLSFQLRQQKRLCTRVRIKIRYADFNTFSLQQRLPPTATDSDLLRCAHQLLVRLFTRRQRVRLLGITLGGLVSGGAQLDLFTPLPAEHQLLAALDHIRNRFGHQAMGIKPVTTPKGSP